ncbi:MAG: transketolase [Flavobacteriales bacterium]|nr:transketolase [Flavobacteriales bacterium]|tara:strand:- start:70082 stop:72508 length:2427 start_codon:yes stop_codon:yes gene_type:complete
MSNDKESSSIDPKLEKDVVKEMVLNDFRIMMESREASLMGRREVLTGKAKFGIFGDGKELAQLCLAKQFMDGDYRSGYYRDQTIMLALGEVSLKEFYAQLFSDTNLENEPHSGGRQMNCHYGSRFINADGSWKDMTKMKITTTDLSPTAAQMPRIMGLGLASKLFRQDENLHQFSTLSNNGNEIVFGTIGDGSTSEGIFLEAINAMGVLQIPVVMSVWDDGHAISVPVEKQTTKGSISEALKGFKKENGSNGIEILKVRGWNYPELCAAYDKAAKLARENHIPVLVHVVELTQPQGHSTSGSHERYKSKERLEWESKYDCTVQFKQWILDNNWASEEELSSIHKQCKKVVRDAKNAAWKEYIEPLKAELTEVLGMIDAIASKSRSRTFIKKYRDELTGEMDLYRNYMISCAKKVLRLVRFEDIPDEKQRLADWLNESKIANHDRYNSLLYAHGDFSSSSIKEIAPTYEASSNLVDGRIILRENFDAILAKNPKVFIFGEDTGKIGGVNQGCEGLQEKYGELRVFDTGIREAAIMGKGSGMAIRGLRPIAEIQYLDYLVYGLMTLTDDVASLHWRTKGGQKSPMIIRTRGHRFEGIWHSGSPLGMIINSMRGFVICVPRNMTQAAGMYNTLLEAHDPSLVIEPLLHYRKKEDLPTNLGEFRVPVGIPDVIIEGTDLTIVTYGSCVGIAEESVKSLREVGISAELIDVQTLLPFDINSSIQKSLEKTNRLIVLDEDVSGGATGFMMQQILDEQDGYFHLDSPPRALSAQDHRPAYGSDGNYFSKPNPELIFDTAYEMMNEVDPEKYPVLY